MAPHPASVAREEEADADREHKLHQFLGRRQKNMKAAIMKAWLMARVETVMKEGDAAILLRGVAETHKVRQQSASASRLLAWQKGTRPALS